MGTVSECASRVVAMFEPGYRAQLLRAQSDDNNEEEDVAAWEIEKAIVEECQTENLPSFELTGTSFDLEAEIDNEIHAAVQEEDDDAPPALVQDEEATSSSREDEQALHDLVCELQDNFTVESPMRAHEASVSSRRSMAARIREQCHVWGGEAVVEEEEEAFAWEATIAAEATCACDTQGGETLSSVCIEGQIDSELLEAQEEEEMLELPRKTKCNVLSNHAKHSPCPTPFPSGVEDEDMLAADLGREIAQNSAAELGGAA